MKKWIVWIVGIVWVIAFVISGKYAFSYIYNRNITEKYIDGEYDVDTKPLYVCNVFEPHIAYYNSGNVYYQQGRYDDAKEEYMEALANNPSEEEECSIRINLALAMIYGMGEEYDSPDNIDSSLATLKEARQVLLEKGCALDDGDGHNKTAQKLKEEIDQMIEDLEEKKQQQSQGQSNQDPQNGDDQKPDEEDSREEEIKEQLQLNQADALDEREENMELYEEFNINSDYDYGGTVW